MPAYTESAWPLGLNADPGALVAFPGVVIALALPHDWLGCPVPVGEGFAAAAAAPLTAMARPPASVAVAARVPRRTMNGLMGLSPQEIRGGALRRDQNHASRHGSVNTTRIGMVWSKICKGCHRTRSPERLVYRLLACPLAGVTIG